MSAMQPTSPHLPEVVSAREESLVVLDSRLRVLHARDRRRDAVAALEDVVPPWAVLQVQEAARRSLAGTQEAVLVETNGPGAALAVTASPVHSHEGDVVATIVVLRQEPAAISAPGADADVPRRALLLSLGRTAAPVVVVRAPSGYGKTTLLRQWDASDPRPFAWATLGPEHDDPEVLSGTIAAALAAAAGMPRKGRRLGVEAFLAREGAPSQVLVLDDAHHLTAGGALGMVERIAGDLPEGSRMVLASRRELDGAVARLIRSVPVLHIGPEDLCMSASEGRALFEARGLRVPDDVSIVGFDDLPEARWSSPPLTTVRQPLSEMGALAARTVLRLAQGERIESMRLELATELVVRDSTTALVSSPV